MGRRRLSGLVRVGGLFISLCLVNHFPWAQSVAKSAAPARASRYERVLARYQRHHGRLYGLLKRIKRPRLESFESGGVKYGLPLRAEDAVVEDCTEDELAYLSGFFDGDGCVDCNTDGMIRLQVGQSVQGAAVLLRFRRAFGGGIYRLTDGCGLTVPTIIWHLAGRNLKRAANLLARNSYTKQAQLRIAMNGNIAKDERHEVKHQLKELKTANEVPLNFYATWSYFAGFFDAEGHVLVPPCRNSVKLEIRQKDLSVLHRLMLFLEEEGLNSWKNYSCKNQTDLMRCSVSESSMWTLRQLLVNGLNLKRDQAQIALQLNASNRPEVREKLFQLGGQQNRYKRLDRRGMERGAEIRRLQKRLLRCCNETQSTLLKEELELLQEEHKLQKLEYNCSLMSSDIRRMLNEGAHFRPLESKKAAACRWEAWSFLLEGLQTRLRHGVRGPSLEAARKDLRNLQQAASRAMLRLAQIARDAPTPRKEEGAPGSITVDRFFWLSDAERRHAAELGDKCAEEAEKLQELLKEVSVLIQTVAVEDDRERERLLARRLGIKRQSQERPTAVNPLGFFQLFGVPLRVPADSFVLQSPVNVSCGRDSQVRQVLHPCGGWQIIRRFSESTCHRCGGASCTPKVSSLLGRSWAFDQTLAEGESAMPSYAEAMAERRAILQEQRQFAVVDDGESRAAQEDASNETTAAGVGHAEAMEDFRLALREERQLLQSMAQDNLDSWKQSLQITFERLEGELRPLESSKSKPFDLDFQQKERGETGDRWQWHAFGMMWTPYRPASRNPCHRAGLTRCPVLRRCPHTIRHLQWTLGDDVWVSWDVTVGRSIYLTPALSQLGPGSKLRLHPTLHGIHSDRDSAMPSVSPTSSEPGALRRLGSLKANSADESCFDLQQALPQLLRLLDGSTSSRGWKLCPIGVNNAAWLLECDHREGWMIKRVSSKRLGSNLPTSLENCDQLLQRFPDLLKDSRLAFPHSTVELWSPNGKKRFKSDLLVSRRCKGVQLGRFIADLDLSKSQDQERLETVCAGVGELLADFHRQYSDGGEVMYHTDFHPTNVLYDVQTDSLTIIDLEGMGCGGITDDVQKFAMLMKSMVGERYSQAFQQRYLQMAPEEVLSANKAERSSSKSTAASSAELLYPLSSLASATATGNAHEGFQTLSTLAVPETGLDAQKSVVTLAWLISPNEEITAPKVQPVRRRKAWLMHPQGRKDGYYLQHVPEDAYGGCGTSIEKKCEEYINEFPEILEDPHLAFPHCVIPLQPLVLKMPSAGKVFVARCACTTTLEQFVTEWRQEQKDEEELKLIFRQVGIQLSESLGKYTTPITPQLRPSCVLYEDTCGELCGEPCWDETLELWRAKCTKVSALAELWQPKTLGSLAPPTEVQAAKAAQLQRQQEIRVGEEWSEHWKLPANRTPQAMMNFWEEVKAFDLYADHCLLYKQAPFADATSQSSACRDSWL
eukprot:s1927_g5.t3